MSNLSEETKNTASWQQLIDAIDSSPARGAWTRGVKEYALELVKERNEEGANFESMSDPAKRKALLLNGARSWKEYSEGGCSLVYDGDIVQRLMPPSEQKRLRYREGGWKDPDSSGGTWLEVQARALYQAEMLINRTMRRLTLTNEANSTANTRTVEERRGEPVGATAPLFLAAHQGEVEKLETLIRNGADVNARGANGETPYMVANGSMQQEAALFLREAGADVNARDNDGLTASDHLQEGLKNAQNIAELARQQHLAADATL